MAHRRVVVDQKNPDQIRPLFSSCKISSVFAGSGRSMAFAVASFFVLFKHNSRRHFFGALSVPSGFFRALLMCSYCRVL